VLQYLAILVSKTTATINDVCCSVLQHVVVCCSVLQCVAVCCSVLQCAAVCCSVLQCVTPLGSKTTAPTNDVCCSMLQCVSVCCSVLHRVAACCSVLQCTVVYHSVLQCLQQFSGSQLSRTLLSVERVSGGCACVGLRVCVCVCVQNYIHKMNP